MERKARRSSAAANTATTERSFIMTATERPSAVDTASSFTEACCC